jgi:hypothetical protein
MAGTENPLSGTSGLQERIIAQDPVAAGHVDGAGHSIR